MTALRMTIQASPNSAAPSNLGEAGEVVHTGDLAAEGDVATVPSLWDIAYDALKGEERDATDRYEDILPQVLRGKHQLS